MRLLVACGVLCSLLACSTPERHHETKKQQYPLRYHPNRGPDVDRWNPTEKQPEPGLDGKPVQVTTHSGSLMQPGPEAPGDFDEPATPTFAPEEAAARPARRFSSEIPQGNRAPMRTSMSQAGSQDPNNKPTMASWIKGFRSEKSEPETPSTQQKPSASTMHNASEPPDSSSAEFGSSIDPRRVYRGPKPPEEIDESRYGSRFNETGVPQTGTDFQGRADSAF
jgi:hypothetical protein